MAHLIAGYLAQKVGDAIVSSATDAMIDSLLDADDGDEGYLGGGGGGHHGGGHRLSSTNPSATSSMFGGAPNASHQQRPASQYPTGPGYQAGPQPGYPGYPTGPQPGYPGYPTGPQPGYPGYPGGPAPLQQQPMPAPVYLVQHASAAPQPASPQPEMRSQSPAPPAPPAIVYPPFLPTLQEWALPDSVMETITDEGFSDFSELLMMTEEEIKNDLGITQIGVRKRFVQNLQKVKAGTYQSTASAVPSLSPEAPGSPSINAPDSPALYDTPASPASPPPARALSSSPAPGSPSAGHSGVQPSPLAAAQTTSMPAVPVVQPMGPVPHMQATSLPVLPAVQVQSPIPQYPQSPIPQYPQSPIPQYPQSPIPQYPPQAPGPSGQAYPSPGPLIAAQPENFTVVSLGAGGEQEQLTQLFAIAGQYTSMDLHSPYVQSRLATSIRDGLVVKVSPPPACEDNKEHKVIRYTVSVATPSRTYPTVSRRFNDFVWLHKQLAKAFVGIILPTLPPKELVWNKADPGFINARAHRLKNFVIRCLIHPEVSTSYHLDIFLSAEAINRKVHDTAPRPKGALSSHDVEGTIWDYIPTLGSVCNEIEPTVTEFKEYSCRMGSALCAAIEMTTKLCEAHECLAGSLQSMVDESLCVIEIGEMRHSSFGESLPDILFMKLADSWSRLATLERILSDSITKSWTETLSEYVELFSELKRLLELRERFLGKWQTNERKARRLRRSKAPPTQKLQLELAKAVHDEKQGRKQFEALTAILSGQLFGFIKVKHVEFLAAARSFATAHHEFHTKASEIYIDMLKFSDN